MADQDYPNLYEDMEASAQRTRAAAIAFEHVLGGPEADMVPVNGYPDQPTIAGRIKARVDPLVDTLESAAESVKRFAGVSAVAPATRIDGTPLQPGDEYQNSAEGLRYSWSGSSWVVLNASVQQLTQKLSDKNDPANGTGFLGYIAPYPGATPRTAHSRLSEKISIFDLVPVAQHAGIRAGTTTYDASADIAKGVAWGWVRSISETCGARCA